MNLEKAIEILEEQVKHPYSAKKMAYPDALKLLIEAGKREKAHRQAGVISSPYLLPGETEE